MSVTHFEAATCQNAFDSISPDKPTITIHSTGDDASIYIGNLTIEELLVCPGTTIIAWADQPFYMKNWDGIMFMATAGYP